MASPNGNTEKKFRFEPSTIGLHELLEMFKPIWTLFRGVHGNVLAETEASKRLFDQKGEFIHYATRLIENGGNEIDYRKTIGFGVKIMGAAQGLLEALVDDEAAQGRYNCIRDEIKKLSKEVWEKRESEIVDAYARFSMAAQGVDLIDTVNTYAELIRLMNSVRGLAQDKANATRRERDTRDRQRKLETARTGAGKLLAALAD
jgi:hypothetical protein